MATEKNRKSEEQERFDQADNAGRFAENDTDSQEAKNTAMQSGAVKHNTGYDSGPVQQESGRRVEPGDEVSNTSARRGDAQVQDFAGDAHNANDSGERPLNKDELNRARNKANESKGTEDSSSG